jgi:hypothetical protein
LAARDNEPGDGGISRREIPRNCTTAKAPGLEAFREAAKVLLRCMTAAPIMRRARAFSEQALHLPAKGRCPSRRQAQNSDLFRLLLASLPPRSARIAPDSDKLIGAA